MADPKKDSVIPKIPESPTVIIGDKEYVVNELTARQDTELAKLFKGAEFIDIITGAIKTPVKIPLDDKEAEDVLLIQEQERDNKLAQSLIGELAKGNLIEFLSIVLVPADTLVYRETIAKENMEFFGDLKNTEIQGVVKHFFTLNVQSLQSTVASLTEVEPETVQD